MITITYSNKYITIFLVGRNDVDNFSKNVSLYIWNVSGTYWEKLQEVDASDTVTVIDTISVGTDFIDSNENNSLYLLVVSNNGTNESVSPSVLYTDYIEIKV